MEISENNIKSVEKKYSNEKLIVYTEKDFTKEELLEYMVHNIKENSDAIAEEGDFFKNILEREKIGTTAIGQGIAIPHARFLGAKEIVVSLFLLEKPLEFGALDGEPVKLVIMVGAPQEQGKEYLTLISTIARAFRNKEYRESVFSSKNYKDLIKKLEEFK
ncbi:MAG: PTS sugar transporter subunit IIA [Fusobacteriaceae bacterium]